MPPTKAKRPTDRQPKAATISPTPVNVYTFTHQGKEYSLPSGATAVPHLPGRALRDAYVDGEAGQMRLAFLMLEAIDADPAALEALYDMPAPVMLEHVQGWMSLAPVEGDASLGESLS